MSKRDWLGANTTQKQTDRKFLMFAKMLTAAQLHVR